MVTLIFIISLPLMVLALPGNLLTFNLFEGESSGRIALLYSVIVGVMNFVSLGLVKPRGNVSVTIICSALGILILGPVCTLRFLWTGTIAAVGDGTGFELLGSGAALMFALPYWALHLGLAAGIYHTKLPRVVSLILWLLASLLWIWYVDGSTHCPSTLFGTKHCLEWKPPQIWF